MTKYYFSQFNLHCAGAGSIDLMANAFIKLNGIKGNMNGQQLQILLMENTNFYRTQNENITFWCYKN